MCPCIIPIRDKVAAMTAEKDLMERFYFLEDGKCPFSRKDLKELDGFKFKRYGLSAQHYVHHSGFVFMRIVTDQQGWGLFILFDNRILFRNNEELRKVARKTYQDIRKYLLNKSNAI